MNEALMVTDNEMKQAGMHNAVEEEINDESNKRNYKNQEINNHSEDGMVNADNIVTNSNVLPPDTAKPAAEMPEKATDNGALFVNERQYTSVSTVNVNAGEPNDIQQDEIGNTCYEAESASAKFKSQCTSVCLAEVPVKGGKMLPDSADALGVCSADVGQQTDSITHKFDGGKSEAVYDTNDKTKTTQCDKGVFINEPPRTEARATPSTNEILARNVSANEVQQDTNQTQHQSFSELVPQPVIHENKNEQKSILQQQHEQHSQALMEENCTSNNIVELNQFHKLCSKSVVSPTKLPTDQCNHCVPSFAACKVNSNVDADTKTQSDILVEIRDLVPMDHEEDITEEISSNAQRKVVRTDDQQKEPHLETVISDSETIEDLQVTVFNADALGNLKQLQGNLAPINDSLSVTNNNLLNFTTNADHSVALASNSQSTEEANGSATDFAATVESRQAAVSKMDSHAEIPEVRDSSQIAENEFKSIFISTSVNPVATIALDHRNKTSTSETESASNKATTSQSGWKFCRLPILDSGKGKDILNKITASHSISVPRDKLEAPVISRRFPSALIFPRQIGEVSLRNSSAADSPSAKRLNDTFNTSSVPLYPKRNSNVEWNATAQTFSDFSQPPEQEKPCSSSSKSFKIPHSPASMKYQGQFTGSSSTSCSQSYFDPQSPETKLPEVSISNTMPATQELFEEECDSQYSIIKGQISKIERFLSLDRLKHTRKRKADNSGVESITKITPT
ncbi:uncharacterized protein LOC144684968 isoform X1 [Cetorhinus maximus]